jgi:hypothetical protein
MIEDPTRFAGKAFALSNLNSPACAAALAVRAEVASSKAPGMQENIISSSLRPLFLVIVVGTAICAAATAAHGQAGPRQIKLSERENSARENQITTKRDPMAVLAEVNEDLRQLKALSGDISTHATVTDQPLNYNSIIENVTEIRKRSRRLSTDLALPHDEKKDKGEDFKDAEKGELQPALAVLNKLLDSFLHNPIFSDPGAIDIQLAAKARRDLDDIIVLSEKLRKNADKRSKTNGKTQ